MKLEIGDKYFFNPNDKEYKVPSWIQLGEIYHIVDRVGGREEPVVYFKKGVFISTSHGKELITYRELVDSGKAVKPISYSGYQSGYYGSRRGAYRHTGYSTLGMIREEVGTPVIFGTGGGTPFSNSAFSDMWKVDTYDIETGGLGSLGGSMRDEKCREE